MSDFVTRDVGALPSRSPRPEMPREHPISTVAWDHYVARLHAWAAETTLEAVERLERLALPAPKRKRWWRRG